MSKADKMFEKLGYELYLDDDDEICYKAKSWYISFYKKYKVFRCCEDDFYNTACNITLEELKAINEKVKELGWNE